MSGEVMCSGCKEAYEEVRKLEDKQDERHEQYVAKVHEYEVDKAVESGILKAIHKRMDVEYEGNRKLREAFTSHMNEEATHHLAVESALLGLEKTVSSISTTLKFVPTKTELETQKGRINTILKLGSFAFLIICAIGGVLVWYVKEDIKSHTTKSSVINSKVIKKAIK